MMPAIAMITDFGLKDPFTGIMKGVIRNVGSTAEIIDITHGINAGDIKSAAIALAMSYRYYPEGTIFLVVIDPLVGTERRPIAVTMGAKTIVCPDNGIISVVLSEYPEWHAVHLDRSEFFLPKISSTFHGRDIFAPIAAHLSMGIPVSDLGSPIDDVKTTHIPEATTGDRHIQGEVIYIDGFGNLITNISEEIVTQWAHDSKFSNFKIHTGSVEIIGINNTFSEVSKGKPLTVFGSFGMLEVAVNGGSASALAGSSIGAKVLLYK
ncbi:MAG: SAM hydrolase/SAM-dependent halogenase family protein [Armatimonadota bacterium]